MNQLIPVVNKLQDVFTAIGKQFLELPQIVVIGSQSSGKSSVLENVVGRDFLPRGTGICTRRPLVLQLYSLTSDDLKRHSVEDPKHANEKEWGEFLHLPGQKFYDFSEIRAEIQRETDRLAGSNKNVSNKSINLKIFSPHVLNLTLVDLPGITKVPTGDQPEDVEEQIRAMCFEFISNPNAIILAVTAANQDIANSEGLKMARSVDPQGSRTIGVLTKVDIMDHGTDCCDVLANQLIPLQRGYIAVINRSQKDIQENLSIRKGLAKEAQYFQSHPKYRNMLTKCGTANMARILNHLLMHHIRDCLPEIRARINKLLVTVQSNISSLGDSIDDKNTSEKGVALLRILSQFAINFNNKVEGKGSNELSSEMTELYGGARISYIFNEVFGKRLKTLDPFEGLTEEDIRTAIANANGTRPSLFVPEISFDLLVRKQIVRLEQPGLDCLDLVYDELYKMIKQSITMDLTRFPLLQESTINVTNTLLRKCMLPAKDMISNLIAIELAYINTSHPDFVGGKQAVAVAQQSRKLQQQNKIYNNNNQDINNNENMNSNNATPQSSLSIPVNNNTGGGFVGVFPSRTMQNSNTISRSTNQTTPTDSMNDNKSSNEFNVIKLSEVPEKLRCSATPTDKERVETEIIKTLIQSYFDIVKKNFMDLVPKTVMRFMVIQFKETIQNELVSQLYKEEVMSELMRETEDIASKRKAYREMRDLLYKATEIVNEVRDYQPGMIDK